MPDINWNGDAESAPFTSRLDDASGNLILAETDTGTALFEWDGSAWQFRGPVEMNGEDVSGIGSLTATSGNFDSVNTEEASISQLVGQLTGSLGKTFSSGTESKPDFFESGITDPDLVTADSDEDNMTVQKSGIYSASAVVYFGGSSADDSVTMSFYVNDSQVGNSRVSAVNAAGLTEWFAPVPSYPLELSAGDVVDVRVEPDQDISSTNSASSQHFSIVRQG